MIDGARNGWQRFWDKGYWWQPFLVAVAYIAVFLGIGLVTSTLFADMIDPTNLIGSASSVFFAQALPILIGGAVVLLFVISLRRTQPILGRQPIRGSGWMWIAVVLLVIPIALRLAATNWSAYETTTVLALLFLGLCIGFTEELLARGVAVDLLRRGGASERVVMILSSAVFGLLHASNILTGQPVVTVLVTVVYAFGFGAMMYLALRVTGRIVWPMLLHAATDPTTILATGGIDSHGADAGSAGLLGIAGMFNILYLVFAVIAIFLVKGRVHAAESR